MTLLSFDPPVSGDGVHRAWLFNKFEDVRPRIYSPRQNFLGHAKSALEFGRNEVKVQAYLSFEDETLYARKLEKARFYILR